MADAEMIAIGDKINHSNHHLPGGQSNVNKLCSMERRRVIPDSSCHLPPGQEGIRSCRSLTEPSKTQKRGFVMPGDVALSAVSWSPTPIATRSGKAGLRGKLPSVPRSVVPRNTDRPRSRLPRGSSPPPSSTSCWRSRPRSPTRCQRPPSSQMPGPSVASSFGASQPALPLRMRGGPDSSTPSVVLLGRTESCISPLPRRPPSTSSLTSPLDRDHRGEEAETRHGHQRPADDGEGHQGNYIYFVLT